MTSLSLATVSDHQPINGDDKLLGAAEILSVYQAQPIESLKSALIAFDKPSLIAQAYQHNSYLCDQPDDAIFNAATLDNYETQCFDNLYQHLRYLQLEFIGQSELCFYHTVLIVLLRRGYEVNYTFKTFDALWQSQSDYFFDRLSLRWLVSAIDTFVDFSNNPLRQAILINAVSLINTLKIYETQLFLLTDNRQPRLPRVDALTSKHQGLYDGLTFFRLGSDDTLAQMRGRFERFAKQDKFATQFLLVIFARLHKTPSAFNLIKQFHNPDWAYWQHPI